MKKKTRTILFLICLFLFILISPLAVLYSQGYRIDPNSPNGGIKISQSGGLFLKILPKQADVYINKKLAKRTDFFFGSILIENLLPKKHEVEVKKEGYHSWQKNIEIKKTEVIEFKNIILFPQEIIFNSLANKTNNIWISHDQKKIVSLEQETAKNTWSLKLYYLDKKIKSHLIDQSDFSIQEIELISLSFSLDSKTIYLEIDMKEEGEKTIKNFILEIDKEKPILTETNEKINEEKINQEDFLLEEKIEHDFQISPDNKKLAYFSNHEIWILFLKDENNEGLEKKSGEKILLIRLSEPIISLAWINNDYLTFIANNQIKISEIDNRDRVNVIDIFDSKKLPENGSFVKVIFSQFDKKIYLLTEKKLLYESSILFP